MSTIDEQLAELKKLDDLPLLDRLNVLGWVRIDGEPEEPFLQPYEKDYLIRWGSELYIHPDFLEVVTRFGAQSMFERFDKVVEHIKRSENFDCACRALVNVHKLQNNETVHLNITQAKKNEKKGKKKRA